MTAKMKDAIQLLEDDHQEVKALFEKFEKLSDRSKVSKKTVADQICDALTVHSMLEEELFYPEVRAAIKDDDMMDEALVEHSAAKELIAQIEAIDPGDELYDAKVKVLSEQIDHHVEEEEGEMFPKVRKSKIDLQELGERMQARKAELQGASADA